MGLMYANLLAKLAIVDFNSNGKHHSTLCTLRSMDSLKPVKIGDGTFAASKGGSCDYNHELFELRHPLHKILLAQHTSQNSLSLIPLHRSQTLSAKPVKRRTFPHRFGCTILKLAFPGKSLLQNRLAQRQPRSSANTSPNSQHPPASASSRIIEI